MSEKRLHTATRIVRNSIVLFLVAAMAKGSGLIIAIIIARYLGAEALGVYAVLIAVTMILELVAPLGQQDVLIRSVAREPRSTLRLWVESTVATIAVAVLGSVALASGSRLLGLQPDIQLAADVVALSLPFGSSNIVAQAALQGLERLKFLAIAGFLGRVLMLATLIVLLLLDAGVVAAFIGRMAYHVVTLGMLIVVIMRWGRSTGAATNWLLAPRHLATRVRAALPFAAQRVLNEASVRGSVLVLPFLISMQFVGWFDAADRVRQTIATMIPIVMLAIMPAFSRTFRQDRAQGAILATYSLKFLLIAVLPAAFLVAASAPGIINLLYGSEYAPSVPVLQIVIWAQVFLSADMILKQAMIASDHEVSMLRRSAVGLFVQIVLTVTLVHFFGIEGVAMAMVCASAFIVGIDMHFVRRHIVGLDFLGAVGKPLLCAAGGGVVALTLDGHHLLVILAAAGVTYLCALFLLRTFSTDELMLMRRIPGQLLKKRG
jgi:O-antigen/teichoic acid export membrane protein